MDIVWLKQIISNATALLCSACYAAATPLALLHARFRDSKELAAENLVLRRQLAMFVERNAKSRRLTGGDRLAFAWLSLRCAADAFVFKPGTLIRWHREGFKLLWRWKSRPGRPRIPQELRDLIGEMANDNPLWGEERIANELLLKLGVRISPRTVRKYMPGRPRRRDRYDSDQTWSTFLRNHAEMVLACDFMTAVTAKFQILYVFVMIELGSRRILHFNVTANPTAEWTTQQMREALPWENSYEWLLHDRGSCFSQLDGLIKSFGLKILRTPPRSPKANAACERVNGTIRREFLDHVIPMNEEHLRRLLREWVGHYNCGRPHMSLGPGLPEPSECLPVTIQSHRHRLPRNVGVSRSPVLGGLHHEYRLALATAPT